MTTAANLATLHAALKGVDLDDRDEYFLAWFAAWDTSTCERFASMIDRAKCWL